MPPPEDGLRAWLNATAAVAPHRIDELLQVLDKEEVDTVGDLRFFSETPAFSERLTSTTAMKIRAALASTTLGGPLPAAAHSSGHRSFFEEHRKNHTAEVLHVSAAKLKAATEALAAARQRQSSSIAMNDTPKAPLATAAVVQAGRPLPIVTRTGLLLRPYIVLVHVAKAAGESASAALKPWCANRLHPCEYLEAHGHNSDLPALLRRDALPPPLPRLPMALIVTSRDPIDRAISAFNWRDPVRTRTPRRHCSERPRDVSRGLVY